MLPSRPVDIVIRPHLRGWAFEMEYSYKDTGMATSLSRLIHMLMNNNTLSSDLI
jgi:hypothetical protein